MSLGKRTIQLYQLDKNGPFYIKVSPVNVSKYIQNFLKTFLNLRANSASAAKLTGSSRSLGRNRG